MDKSAQPAAFVAQNGNTKQVPKINNLPAYNSKLRPRLPRIVFFVGIHLAGLYGLYLMFTSAKLMTWLWVYVMHVCGLWGVLAGAHRFWSHKSYKAKLPLVILLAFFNTIAYQDYIIRWVRDHRLHHKWSETDGDPQNSTRGFFYSHIGWLLCDRLPEVKAKGRDLNLSDILNDPILRFQKRYYYHLVMICSVLMPTAVPMYLWGESFENAFFLNFLRYVMTLNGMLSLNSVAHKFGYRPYNKTIDASQSLLASVLTAGEGSHNYHHAFPWDYKGSEFVSPYNVVTLFILAMEKIGWAYDLRTVPEEMIINRVKKYGDGSHPLWGGSDGVDSN